MLPNIQRSPVLNGLAVAVLVACLGCVPMKSTVYAYERALVSPVPSRKVSLILKPNQGGSLGPAPRNFVVLVAVESDSLVQLDTKLRRVELRGVSDTNLTVLTDPAVERVDPTGRILSLMHLSVPLLYQEYHALTVLEWDNGGQRDSVAMSWTVRPAPQRTWFIWPWQMITDG